MNTQTVAARRERIPGPVDTPWIRFQKRIAEIDSCPLPTNGCHDGRVAMSERGGIRPATPGEIGSVPCPVVCPGCHFSRRLLTKRAAAIANRAKYAAQFMPGLVDPLDTVVSENVNKCLGPRRDKICILSGPPGRGKDFAIARWFLESDRPVGSLYWFKAPEIIELYSSDSKRFHEIIEQKNIVFVIEEFGTEPEQCSYNRGQSLHVMQTIFDRVTGQGGIVFASTNLDAGQIEKQYKARMWSRINGMGSIIAINANDVQDMREWRLNQ